MLSSLIFLHKIAGMSIWTGTILSFFIGSCSVGGFRKEPTADLRIEINLEGRIEPNRSIPVRVTITNQGLRAVQIPLGNALSFTLELKGRVLRPRRFADARTRSATYSSPIETGKSLHVEMNAQLHGSGRNRILVIAYSDGSQCEYRGLAPDTYHAYVVLKSRTTGEAPESAWRGQIRSASMLMHLN